MKDFIIIFVIAAALASPALTQAVPEEPDQRAAEGPVKVTVTVDGLSCPFCAYGLEKKVKQMEGVSAFLINIEGGYVEVIFEEREFFEEESLEEAVKDAGFTPRNIRVEEAKE